MITALEILCAKLGIAAYDPAFAASGKTDLSSLGREFQSVIMGVDPGIGPIPYGFISSGPDGFIATFRGTQTPDGSYVEWLDDFKAVLEPCPFAPGCQWHKGFGEVYSTLNIGGVPVGQAIKGLLCHGHSLGGPLATFAALESGGPALGLFASPKPGDSALAALVQTTIRTIWSYTNPNDAVPRVPLTVDWPFRFEDFQRVMPPFQLQPNLVTPAIPSDWASSHALANYLALLEAAA